MIIFSAFLSGACLMIFCWKLEDGDKDWWFELGLAIINMCCALTEYYL